MTDQPTLPSTVLIVPARAFGKAAAIALEARARPVLVVRDLRPARTTTLFDGITRVRENEADL